MGLVGSNIFGREALAEIRVNAAQDLGDRRGLSVPVGTKGTIYVNGNADIRDGAAQ